MRRHGDDAAVAVVSNGIRDGASQCNLPVGGPLTGDLDRTRLWDFAQEGDKTAAQVRKYGLDPHRPRAWLEVVQKSVVGLVTDFEALGLFPLQRNEWTQRSGIGGEVICWAGLDPRGGCNGLSL